MDENSALRLALLELKKKKTKFLEKTVCVSYWNRLPIGAELKGWVIDFKLDVPDTFEPNTVFVYVSDPDGIVYVPDII